MGLPCYKLNNSYTIYVNYHYLNECINAGKAYAKKKKELAEFQKKALTALHSPKTTKAPQIAIDPLKVHSLVQHKKFGLGKVVSTDNNGVMRVLFGADMRRFIYPDAVHQGYLTIV